MINCRKKHINNLRSSIIERHPNESSKFASEKAGLWDVFLLINAFISTAVLTATPYLLESLCPQTSEKNRVLVYGIEFLGFVLFAINAYFEKSNYAILQKEFVQLEKDSEINKVRNKENVDELSERLETIVSIVKEITDEQHNGNNVSATYAQIIANHLYLECQRRFGKDISVSFYDMNENNEVCMKAFSTRIQNIDKPDLYHRGWVHVSDKSIEDRFYVLCLTDNEDKVYDLPNRKAIRDAFGFRNTSNKRKKKIPYNQYISFKVETENKHTILVEVIAHNDVAFGEESQLGEVAADMLWRYGHLIQNYWKLFTTA